MSYAAMGQAAGTIIGAGMARSQQEDAKRQRRKAIEALLGLDEEVGPSAFEGEDPRARGAQLAALAQLENMYAQGGMDPQSEATLRAAMDDTAAAERGQRGAIVQNYASRGLSTSGAGLAAQLANQQGAAGRNARAGASAAADARTRALQAMTGAAGVASNMRGQDYDRAGALDAIAKFNATQRTNKAGMVANTYTGHANQAQQQANYNTERYQAMGGGIGKAAGAYVDSKRDEDENDQGGW